VILLAIIKDCTLFVQRAKPFRSPQELVFLSLGAGIFGPFAMK